MEVQVNDTVSIVNFIAKYVLINGQNNHINTISLAHVRTLFCSVGLDGINLSDSLLPNLYFSSLKLIYSLMYRQDHYTGRKW